MLDLLNEIIKNKYSFVKQIKSNQLILDWLIEKTKMYQKELTIPEMVYLVKNPNIPIKCNYSGDNLTFLSIIYGFRSFCSKSCQCFKKHNSRTLKDNYKIKTEIIPVDILDDTAMFLKIKDIFDISGNRRYSRTIKENPQVLQWLKEKSSKYNVEMGIPEMVYLLFHSEINPICEKNGGHKSFISSEKGYRDFCEGHCQCRRENQSQKIKKISAARTYEENALILQKKKDTMLRDWGYEYPSQVPEIKEKMEQTSLINYGVRTPILSPIVRQKIKDTNRINLGVDFPFQSPKIIKKCHTTSIIRHGDAYACARKEYKKQTGFDNPMHSSEVKNKQKETFIKRYNADHPLKNPDVVKKRREKCYDIYNRFNSAQNHISDESFDILNDENKFRKLVELNSITKSARILGIDQKTVSGYMKKFGIALPGRSSYESEIAKYLNQLGVKYIQNDSSILKPLQIDFLLEDNKIGIEFNGLYYHSQNSGNKDQKYHYNKWEKCQESGIQLITIFEDEWLDKCDIIKRKIESILNLGKKGVGARKLNIKKIPWKECEIFLNQYHIQGACSPARLNIGAFFNNELSGVMCFSTPKDKNIQWDLVRFSCYQNNPGMASKMLKWFETNYSPKSLVSFSDNRWSNGKLYNTLEFTQSYILGPDYHYTDYKERYRKEKFRKNRLKVLGYDISKTESDIVMNDIGLDKIWDCGKIKWVKVYS